MKLFKLWTVVFFGVFCGLCIPSLNHVFPIAFFYYCWIALLISFVISILISMKLITQKHFPDPSLTRILVSALNAVTVFALLATIPINIDRSFSVWMLNQIDSKSKISVLETQKSFGEFFSISNGEIDRRINEQMQLGNVNFNGKDLYLTRAGKNLVGINRVIAKIYSLNSKYTQNSKDFS